MKNSMQSLFISMLVIAIGTAWLLNAMEIVPGVNWVWTLGLAIAGILILVLLDRNRLTLVAGPFLIVASVLSLLRQQGMLSVSYEVPILVISLGVLMLFVQLARVPAAGRGP